MELEIPNPRVKMYDIHIAFCLRRGFQLRGSSGSELGAGTRAMSVFPAACFASMSC